MTTGTQRPRGEEPAAVSAGRGARGAGGGARARELADLLRSRRDRLQPADTGDPAPGWLAGIRAQTGAEAADIARIRALVHACEDPWSRSLPLHLTASALIVHPPSRRVLLRWHQRQQAWLQVGGHGDPGERDALAIALREAAEETGLPDLKPWPDAAVRQAVIVSVPAARDEPAHEHADVRFLLATSEPAAIRPEKPDAPLRWLTVPEANELTSEANLRELLGRVSELLGC